MTDEVKVKEEPRKFDHGKPQINLIPVIALIEMGKVLAFGARKYASIGIKELEGCVNSLPNVAIKIEKIKVGGYVALVTRHTSENIISNTMRRSRPISESIAGQIEPSSRSTKGRDVNEIQITKKSTGLPRFNENTNSLPLSGMQSWKDKAEAALCAAIKESGFIQTTTMKLEGSEESYVLGATTASDFLTILSSHLKERFNISENLEKFKVTGAGNWAKGLATSRYYDAAMRHLMAWNDGEERDPESGLTHLAHAGVNICFMIWNMVHRPDLDDRWVKTLTETKES